MDSNHDNQLQRLVSYQLDDPGIGKKPRKWARARFGLSLAPVRKLRALTERTERIADGCNVSLASPTFASLCGSHADS